MNSPRIELANGACDGLNHDFFTSFPYDQFASVPQVFVNGQLLNTSQYTLAPPQFVHLADAPYVGDTVQVYYVPR